jgi:presenilin-like A22 family membrane protease
MKHNFKTTLILISLFLITQLLFISVLNIKNKNNIELISAEEKAELSGTSFIISISIGITIGTLIILFLAKKKKNNIWKYWYLLTIFLTTKMIFLMFFNSTTSTILALILVLLKHKFKNSYIHNITEIIAYQGVAIYISEILPTKHPLLYATIMLIIISIYDFIAVFISKHMITLAKFQKNTNFFAGLTINYNKRKKDKLNENKTKSNKQKINKTHTKKQAILGGGDIIFPMIFNASIYYSFHTTINPNILTLLLIIPIICETSSLIYLFFTAKKDKYYPAMPYITSGCIIGFIGFKIILKLII